MPMIWKSVLPGLWSYAVGHVDGGEDGLPDGGCAIGSAEDTIARAGLCILTGVSFIGLAPVVLPESDYEREEREKEELLELVDAS